MPFTCILQLCSLVFLQNSRQWEQKLSLTSLPAFGNLSAYWVALFSLNRRIHLVLLQFDMLRLVDIHGGQLLSEDKRRRNGGELEGEGLWG